MALRRPRTKRSYPTPITNFDDRNRESYIARSGGIGSIKPMGTIVDYNFGKGGRDPSMIGGFGLGTMDPVIEVPTGGPVGMFGEDRSDTTLDMLLEDAFDKQYKPKSITEQGLGESEANVLKGPRLEPAGGILPFNLLQDPTADGGIIDYLSRKLFGDDDPENDYLTPDNEMYGAPIDENELFDPNLPILDASADTYSLPNLLQMLDDARDAGNEEEMERYMNDLELLYPGATISGMV